MLSAIGIRKPHIRTQETNEDTRDGGGINLQTSRRARGSPPKQPSPSSAGYVTAVDISPAMVEKARERFGQHQAYLARQLEAFASMARANEIMHENSKDLSPQQIGAVTAYLATL